MEINKPKEMFEYTDKENGNHFLNVGFFICYYKGIGEGIKWEKANEEEINRFIEIYFKLKNGNNNKRI